MPTPVAKAKAISVVQGRTLPLILHSDRRILADEQMSQQGEVLWKERRKKGKSALVTSVTSCILVLIKRTLTMMTLRVVIVARIVKNNARGTSNPPPSLDDAQVYQSGLRQRRRAEAVVQFL